VLGVTASVAGSKARRSVTFLALPLLLRLLASVLVVELVLRLVLPLPMFRRFLRGPVGSRIISISGAASDARRGALGHGRLPNGHAVDPMLGWTNAPRVFPIDGRFETTSSQGLRGARLYSLEKAADVLRIEVFGDSFAFGTEVGDESTYSAVLEQTLPRAEVLDFGVKGYGLDQALLRFRKEGPAFHPDVVVIGFVSAFVLRDSQSFTFYPKPYFVLRDGKLVLEGVPVPSLDEALRSYAWESRIADVWRMLTATVGRHRPDEGLVTPLLVEFVDEIRASGARAIVVRYPTLSEIGRDCLYTTQLRDVCKRTGATCVDTSPAFDAASARGVVLGAPGAYHFNAAGHRIVAGALADALSVAPGPGTSP
jgi:hypothetical protein